MLHNSSSLVPPPSLSDTLSSSPSPPFADCPLVFLVRPLRVEGGVGTCREDVCLLQALLDELSWMSPQQTYLKHVNHVLAVPLLGDVTETGRDVDTAADIHVHLHGLLLDLTVQV